MFQGSVASTASQRSLGNYRKIAHGSRVDESLFGETTSQKLLSGKGSVAGRSGSDHGAGAASTREGGAARTGVASHGHGQAAPAATIRQDDLYRMQQDSVIKTADDLKHDREEAERQRKERQAVAEARKEKIRSMEATRIANLPLSQLQQEEKDEKERRRAMAAQLREESQDDIKKMDSLFNFAITTAIRERQKAEKPKLQAEERAAERMRELKAELEGLEAQKRTEELEAIKQVKRGEYRQLVLRQLEDARAKQRGLREQYAREDAERLAGLKAELEKEREKKEEMARQKAATLAETLALNEAAIAAKKDRIAAERALEEKADAEAIAAALRKKAEAEEADRIRKEKDKAKAIAAGQVQKFADDREKKEALIMQRNFDEGRRQERARELERLRKEAKSKKELEDARVAMAEAKQMRMAEMIAAEKEEFMRGQAIQEEWLAKERAVEEARARANAHHLSALRNQMEEHDSVLKETRAKALAEEDARREEVAAHMDHLRALRDAKVAQLKALGVDPMFTVELAKYDPWQQTLKKELVSAKDKRK